MFNLSTVAKMLGVNVSPENIAQLEQMLPQIPAKTVEVLTFLNDNNTRFHAELDVIKTELVLVRNELAETRASLNNERQSQEFRHTEIIARLDVSKPAVKTAKK